MSSASPAAIQCTFDNWYCMKFKSAAVLIILATLLSIGASGCSSWRFALDITHQDETYTVGFAEQKEEERETNSLSTNRVFPKVTQESGYQPLVNLGFTSAVGLDYEMIYLGHDTETFFYDIKNNGKSLSTAIKEQNTKSDGNLQMFAVYPIFLLTHNLPRNSFLSVGLAFNPDIFPNEAISYNNAKYYTRKLNSNFLMAGLSIPSGAIFFRSSTFFLEASTKENTEPIIINSIINVAGYRHIF